MMFFCSTCFGVERVKEGLVASNPKNPQLMYSCVISVFMSMSLFFDILFTTFYYYFCICLPLYFSQNVELLLVGITDDESLLFVNKCILYVFFFCRFGSVIV